MTNTSAPHVRSRSRTPTPVRWWSTLAGTAVIAAGFDAAGKTWASNVGSAWSGRIDPGLNDSYALGSVGGHSLILASVSLLVLVAVIWWTAKRWNGFHPWAVGLLVGGGAANAIDRLVNGAVTDFLVVGQLLINLADIAIFAGLVVMTIDAARALRQANAAPASAATEPEGRWGNKPDERAPD
jgi:lipoprotein signal peptidase